jgi:DNA-binding NtrC family response regulator
MPQTRVLIVDDDTDLLQALPDTLRLRMPEAQVDTAVSGTDALQRIVSSHYDAIVTDIKMPGPDGLTLLGEIHARWPGTPTIMITGHGEHELAVHALRGGAFDFIQKPIDRDYFVDSLRRAIQISESRRRESEEQLALEHHANRLERTLEERTRELHETTRIIEGPLKWLMGSGRQLQNIVQQIRRVADSPLTILIQGETGTGKEVVARAIHQVSTRCRKPFAAVDCGAIPETLVESELFGHEKGAFTGADQRKEGRFQLAKDGTLFLDEIANLPMSVQAKLLRVLQERQAYPLGGKQAFQVDARIIAASNVMLQQEARAGSFRLDLYHRLNEFTIVLPPLRERDDILELANEFLAEASMELGSPAREISEAAAAVLLRYSWPGNVRELRNAIRRAAVFASEAIEPEDLVFLTSDPVPATVWPRDGILRGRSLKDIVEAAVADAEREAISYALRVAGGNKSRASRDLQVDYKTLHVKMKQYGIPTAAFRKRSASDLS